VIEFLSVVFINFICYKYVLLLEKARNYIIQDNYKGKRKAHFVARIKQTGITCAVVSSRYNRATAESKNLCKVENEAARDAYCCCKSSAEVTSP